MSCSWYIRVPLAVVLLWVVTPSYSITPQQLCPETICSECTAEHAVCETTSVKQPIPHLRETIQSLNISHQHTPGDEPIELTRDMFKRYNQLRTLRLHGNFHSIQEDAFVDLVELTELNIVNTKISSLPDDLLRSNINIQVVKFNGNNFTSVPFNAVGKANNVTELHFNGNWIPVIFPCDGNSVKLPDSIDHFGSLAALSLRGLQINTNNCSSPTIPSDFFQPLSESLTSLDLSDTSLLRSNETSLASLKKLTNLSLTAVSPFRNCPAQAMEFLKKIPPSLKVLQLIHWENVGSFNQSCFLNDSNLQGLGDLPALTNLSFRYSDYAFGSDLRTDSLPHLPSLTVLDLGFCRIAALSPTSLSRVPNITILNLDGNPLGYRIYGEDRENSPFNHLFVNTLSIQKANIRSDDIITFYLKPITQYFYNVRKVDFTGNYLNQLPAFDPEGNSLNASITELAMDNNELTAFSRAYPNDNFCSDFPDIKSISLAHNSLESIEGLCSGLTYLNLDDNHLDGDEKSTFAIIKNQTSLEEFSISDNYISLQSEPTLLFDMPNLTIFRAADNQIKVIPADFFANNSALREIDLSFNFISHVAITMFDGLNQLERLLLQGNHISIFAEDFIKFIEDTHSVRMIDLRNNPIECACDLDYFKEWLTTTTKVPNVKRLQCSGPEYLVDAHVYNYEVDHFECFVKIPLIHTVFAVLGFLCTLVFVIPCYKYRWYLKHIRVVYWAIKDSLKNVRFEHKCEYDAYVSYNRESQQDAQWVEHSLIPAIEQSKVEQLQNPNQRPKLYVEDRNAPLGTPRFTERAEALQKSRKILIVVSNSYLSSAYCLGEADLAGYEMYGTEFYQPNRVMVLVREELREEIIRAPMTALLVGNVINVDCVGKKQINMWKRIQNFVKTTQYVYRKPNLATKTRQNVGHKTKSAGNGRELEMEQTSV